MPVFQPKTNLMPSYNFYIEAQPNRKKEHAIMLWVRGCPRGEKRPIVIRTGECVPFAKWDKAKQRVKPTYTGSPELNALLNQYEEEAQKCVRELGLNKCNDFETAKSALQALFAPKKDTEFLAIYDQYLSAQEYLWQKNTLKKFKTLRQYLHTFSEIFPLKFERINKDFEDKFRRYLVGNVGLLDNTVAKVFSMVKTFMRWAEEREYHSNLAYKNFKSPTSQIEVIYLLEDELMRLHDYDFTKNPTLEKVRDVFCFQCFTGQRFSDIAKFRFEDVHEGVWHVRTTKTKDIIKVFLIPKALKILEKYRPSGALPVISAQNTNYYIKEACEAAGIDEPTTIVRYQGNKRIETTEPKYKFIATHSARRTFVSLSIGRGMKAEEIMKITGHTSHKMLKKYLDVADKSVHKAMKEAWK